MLSSFTWQQYLFAAGATVALYYLAVLLLYCREDIIHFMKGKLNRAGLPATQPIPPQVSIMGPASPGAAPLLSDAATILVAPQPTKAEGEPEEAVVTAVLEEMKPLLELATESDAEKEELLPLLRLVTARHGSSLQERHQEAIADFLLAQGRLSFTLTPEDLQSLWPGTPSA
jgi:hypothetical protein